MIINVHERSDWEVMNRRYCISIKRISHIKLEGTFLTEIKTLKYKMNFFLFYNGGEKITTQEEWSRV